MSAQTHAARHAALAYGDDQLHTLQRNTFRYFWEETNPENGLIPDHTSADDIPASRDRPDVSTHAIAARSRKSATVLPLSGWDSFGNRSAYPSGVHSTISSSRS